MARPLGFDPATAQAALMRAFWDKGYEGTSMADIEAATGLAKQSLYRLFGDKRGMYRAALRAYETAEVAAGERLLAETPGPARARVAALFEAVLAAAREGRAARGCFLSNACAEADPADAATAALLAAMNARLLAALEAALAAGGDGGAEDPAARAGRARALHAGYVGLRVLLRGGLPVPAAEAAVAALLAPL
jgi:AcrR family transcriptional regulator